MADASITAPNPPPHEGLGAERPFPGSVAERLALVVAPSTGRFQPRWPGGRLGRGELLGHVTGGRGRADDVRMPVDGEVHVLLVRPGQLVRAGQGLAWLSREGALPS